MPDFSALLANLQPTALHLAVFLLFALSAHQVGRFFKRIQLPLITGYLVAGILAGPFILEILGAELVEDLRFIDEISLAVIAFAAGSELYLTELRSRLRSIGWMTVGIVVATLILITLTVFVLSDFIPFMQDMSPIARVAVALLAGSIMVARSPSVVIAIIREMRARGNFTKTILGVTVVSDVVVIVVFGISSSTADALLTGVGLDLSFVVLLVLDIVGALLLGFVVGRIIIVVLSTKLNHWFKIFLIVLLGYAIFVLSETIREYAHENLPFEVLIEPLLTCMIASFVVTNFSRYRREWLDVLHDITPFIFILFFTLTGAALELDVFLQTWPIALVLFTVRIIAIFLGTFVGGTIAGDAGRVNRIYWMGLITQAGVGLGLAKAVAVEFPEFGAAFATMIIATIVLNEIVGPLFLKAAIRRVGESGLPGEHQSDNIRDAVILGIEPQSLALARQLERWGWQVTVADTDQEQVSHVEDNDINVKHIPEITVEALDGLMTNATDAVIGMFSDDEVNYQAFELAYEKFGVQRLVVRQLDPSWHEQFESLGAHIVNPTSAMVHLLEQYVRAPQSADLFMSHDPSHEIAQIRITDPDIAGSLLRDTRLPFDTLILGIQRGNQSIVPHGNTQLHLYDEITLVGPPDDLDEIRIRWGF